MISRSGARWARCASALVAFASCALFACGFDERVSLGSLREVEPPPPGAASVGSGARGPSAGASGATTPSEPLDAAAVEPPPPLDAGALEPLDAAPSANPCSAPAAYLGNFDCTLRFVPSDPRVPPGSTPPPTMMTPIAFGLSPSAGGTTARLIDADFMFLAWGVAFTGRLEGQLDCESGRFDASIADGMTGPLFTGMPQTFVGEVHGILVDPALGTLTGTWWHGPSQDPMGGCTGNWAAAPDR